MRILLGAHADLTLADEHGNTALHMAVIHGNTHMYDLLLEEWRAQKHSHPDWDPETCLTDRPNHAGQRCLALAAAEGSAEVFDHVLTRTGQVMWKHGGTAFTLYPVEGLDDGPESAMSHIMELGRYELLNLPRIRRLLQSKWDSFGRRYFFQRLRKHVLLLAIFQIGITLPRPSIMWDDPSATLFSVDTLMALGRMACEAFVVVHAVRKLMTESQELQTEGWRGYFGVGGALLLENCASLVGGISIMCAVLARLVVGDLLMESAALALASFCSWFYLTFFCMGFKLTGPFVVIAFTMLHTDIPAFLIVATSFLGAFSSALYILSAKVGLGPLMFNFQVFVARQQGMESALPPCATIVGTALSNRRALGGG